MKIRCANPGCSRYLDDGRLGGGYETCRKSCDKALDRHRKLTGYTTPSLEGYTPSYVPATPAELNDVIRRTKRFGLWVDGHKVRKMRTQGNVTMVLDLALRVVAEYSDVTTTTTTTTT